MDESQRKALEEKKLFLETRELRWAWVRFVLTAAVAIATVAITYSTWRWQHQKDVEQRDRDFQATVDARRVATEDRFYKARDALSSPNVASRINAALDLGAFTQRSRGTDVGEATVENAVTALTNRMMLEDDAVVLRAIISTLGNSAPAGLPGVASLNKVTSAEFAELYAEELSAEGRKGPWEGLDREVSANVPALLTGEGATATCSSDFPGGNVALINVAPYIQGLGRWHDFRMSRATVRMKALRHDAAILVATGIALEALLRSNSSRLSGRDLAGVVLYQINVSRVDFSGANLSGTYMCGTATGARFVGSDLRKSDISSLNLSGSDLSHAKIAGAYLPDLRKFGARRVVIGSQATLTCTDWQRSEMYFSDDARPPKFQQPRWLEAFVTSKRGYSVDCARPAGRR